MTWNSTRVLRDRDAGLFLAGTVVSGFGSSAMWLVSGIWVKDLTGSDGLAALCVFALWAPTLAGPLLGALADRIRRKPLLIGTNLTLGALLPLLLAVRSPDRLWLLLAILLLYGALGVVHDAAESALVATAVAPGLLGDFNGLRMSANEGMKLVAPLAGAGLYTAFGGPAVALLDAVTFVVAAALYGLLRGRDPKPRPRRRHTVEGARRLWAHGVLRPLVLAGGTTMLFAGVNGAVIYAVADGLGHSPAYAGVLYAVQGVGSVVTGLVSGPLLSRLGERRYAAYGIALTAAGVALRAVPSEAVALVCCAAIGAGLPCVLIAALTAVQRETPDEARGTATATANTLMFAPNAIGLGAGAALVQLVDHRGLLVVLGVAQLLISLRLRARRNRRAALQRS